MKKLIILLTCLLFIHLGYAQDTHLGSQQGQPTFGLGVGLPYGGLGARFGLNLFDHLNLFGSLGYQLAGVGYNIGLLKDINSASMVQFYFVAMYGTNAAIKVKGLSEYNKVYSGATFGIGAKINSRRYEGNYWDLGLLVPLRSSKYKDDELVIESDPRIKSYTRPWMVLIAIGYNFNLK